jgi:hypothetical protein
VICTAAPGAPDNLFVGPLRTFGPDLAAHAQVFPSRAEARQYLLRNYFTKQFDYGIYEVTDDGRLTRCGDNGALH